MFAARLATVGLCAALLFAPCQAHADDAASPDPIGDFTDGVFLRSRDGGIVLFPGGRLQIDSAFFRQQTPKSGAFVRRARVELRGWFGATLLLRRLGRLRARAALPAPTSRRARSPPPTNTSPSRRSAIG